MNNEKLKIGWEKEAKKGNPDYQYLLGDLYCCGPDIIYDNSEAMFWLCKAAKNNQPDAQHDIGNIYKDDKGLLEFPTNAAFGLPKDNAVAYAWLYKSSLSGNSEAGISLNEVKNKMSEDELQLAENYIGNFPDIPCEMN